MFTLEQVQCFIAVAEELSFRRAADRLVMSQPPLSRQIQRLEQSLGAQLLARTTRSVQLTDAGSVFLERAREILALCEDARRTTAATAVGVRGRIRVGFTPVAAFGALGPWLQVMRAELPDIEVTLSEARSAVQLELLLGGRLDMAFGRGTPTSPVLTSRTVHVEPLVVAVPAAHELTRLGRPPTLADIAQHELVGYGASTGRYFHELSISLFQQAGLTPHHAQYVNEISSILLLVETGMGAALVPRSASRLRTADALQFLSLADVPPDVVRLNAAWRVDRPTPALLAGVARLPSSQPGTPGTGEST